MTQSTRSVSKNKPAKPSPDFPLFPHATGRWAKKIRGKLHYLEPWADADRALQKYLEQKHGLHAGRTPRVTDDRLTVRDLLNRFLPSKRHFVARQDHGADVGRLLRHLQAGRRGVWIKPAREATWPATLVSLCEHPFHLLPAAPGSTRGPDHRNKVRLEVNRGERLMSAHRSGKPLPA